MKVEIDRYKHAKHEHAKHEHAKHAKHEHAKHALSRTRQLPKNEQPLTPEEPEDLRERGKRKLIGVFWLDWYAKTREISLTDLLRGRAMPPEPTFDEEVARLLARLSRNALLKSALEDLYQESTLTERRAMQQVGLRVLKDKTQVSRMQRIQLEDYVQRQVQSVSFQEGVDITPYAQDMGSILFEVRGRITGLWF